MARGLTYVGGLTMVLLVAAMYVTGNLSILFVRHLPAGALAAAILSALAVVMLICRNVGVRTLSLGLIIGLALSAVYVAVCVWLPDISFDGIIYHQESVMAYVNGWNPLTQGPQDYPAIMWVHHYPRMTELTGAMIVRATGLIESYKSINLILMTGVSLLAYDALGEMPGRRRAMRFITALIIALNPIGLSQMLTGYNDYAGYYLYLLTIIGALYIMSAGGRRATAGALLTAVSVVLAIGVKFNIFFYEGLCMFAILGWMLWSGRQKCRQTDRQPGQQESRSEVCRNNRRNVRIFVTSGVLALAVGLLLAWNPYVTNLLGYGHPLYPLMGAGSVDIMDYNTPEVYAGHNRVVNFFISLLTPSRPYIDNRIGGFGFMMPLMLLLSIVTVVVWRRDISRGNLGWCVYLMIVVTASCFVFDQSWWARYISQLWLVPAAAAVILYRLPCRVGDKWMRRANAMLTTLFVCCIINSAAALLTDALLHYRRMPVMAFLQSDETGDRLRVANCLPQIRRKLEESGKRVIEVPPDSLAGSTGIYYIFPEEDMTLPMIQLNADEVSRFMEYGRARHMDFSLYVISNQSDD